MSKYMIIINSYSNCSSCEDSDSSTGSKGTKGQKELKGSSGFQGFSGPQGVLKVWVKVIQGASSTGNLGDKNVVGNTGIQVRNS